MKFKRWDTIVPLDRENRHYGVVLRSEATTGAYTVLWSDYEKIHIHSQTFLEEYYAKAED